MKVSFQIGPDVLFKYSVPEHDPFMACIGDAIREARVKAGMTQLDLARKSGTSRTYISRIENNRSDIELATLNKIVETGLGKKLEIKVKERPKKTYSTQIKMEHLSEPEPFMTSEPDTLENQRKKKKALHF